MYRLFWSISRSPKCCWYTHPPEVGCKESQSLSPPAKKYCETLKVLCALALSLSPLLKSMIQFNHEAVDEWWKLVNNWNSIMRSNFVCSQPSVKYRERIIPLSCHKEGWSVFRPKLWGFRVPLLVGSKHKSFTNLAVGRIENRFVGFVFDKITQFFLRMNLFSELDFYMDGKMKQFDKIEH